MQTDAVKNYGWTGSGAAYSGQYLVPFLVPLLHRLGSRRVADIGAGNGYLCGVLSREGFDAVGVEYDAAGCQIARATHSGVNFYSYGVQDDPQALLEQEDPFDTVVSTEVVEHLFAPHLLPRYAANILKPGGRLVISTPYHGYLKNLALSLADKWDHHHTVHWHGGHIKFFSRRTLTELLEQNGFKVEEFHGVGRLPLLWKSMVIVAVKLV